MVGIYVPVLAKGCYTPLSPEDRKLGALPATSVVLTDIGVGPGDFLAIRAEGAFKAADNLAAELRMGAVFFGEQGEYIPPAKGALHNPFVNAAMDHPPYSPTETPDDFAVSYSSTMVDTIVRVPKKAVRIAFSVGDSSYYNNSEATTLGVRLWRPNHAKPTFAVVVTDASPKQEPDEPEFGSDELFGLDKLPEGKGFSTSPFAEAGGDDAFPQWRGWYLLSGWHPKNSEFRTKVDGPHRTHKGWDIACPGGTKLIAPVGPALFSYRWVGDDGGMAACFSFMWEGEARCLFYAHCWDSLWPVNTIINLGDQAAVSGCSGNSLTKENCGTWFTDGGRSDHVHVGLSKAPLPQKGKHIDPRNLLKWDIKTSGR